MLCLYVAMYVCMHVGLYVYVSVCPYVYMCTCVHVLIIYVALQALMNACIQVRVYVGW